MKFKNLLFATIAALALMPVSTPAPVVVGYFNYVFQPGDNWFGNQLNNTANDLDTLIMSAPTGTTVSLWNPTSDSFGQTSTWNGSQWSLDLTLNPGNAALLDAPTLFTNTFTGTVVNFPPTNPPPFSGPNGLYLLSCIDPLTLSSNSVFDAIVGRDPHNGEQVTVLDALTQTTTTSTYSGGAWDIIPALAIGEAALFNIGPVPVPEPAWLGLVLVGAGTLSYIRRRQRSQS
jgi:hypothetical protein